MPQSLSLPGSTGLKQSITDLLRKRGSRLLPVKEIHERLEGIEASREEVERAVEELEQDGIIVAVRGKRYSLLEFTPYHAGRIRVHPDGYGTVFGGGEEPDIFIDRRSMKGAMNGDLVVVRVDKHSPKFHTIRQRKLIIGEVTTVLRRAHRTVVGRFHADPEQPFVTPFDSRLDHDIVIDRNGTMDARDEEMVNVEIDRYPDRTSHIARGRVVEVLGFIGEPGVDIELVIRKLQIPHRFPPEVLAAADAIPDEVTAAEIAKRVDLREHNIVTIDGETAKDFDDAVEVQLLPNGNYLLGVHIADVSHYVTEGSALDEEAFERGTSVYFPGRAVPMLPERLSNGICSLNPRVERLTFSVDIEIDRKGRFVDRKVYRSVIRTKERTTYTNVNAFLVNEGVAQPSGMPPHGVIVPPPEELRARYGYLLDDFTRMHALYDILRKRREARGSIDFDLPEAEVILDSEGVIDAIKPTGRNVAHRIIEEFMLAANEVVASELVFANQPGIFRVHQQPDPQKLEDLREILKEFKLTLRGDLEEMRPGELQRVMKSVEGTPEERFLSNIVLRSMKRAYYSEENVGHFALAIANYAHFTSPIRRYPDLIVHRRLGEMVDKGPLYGERLAEVERAHPLYAAQSSDRERRADEASREVLEWKKVIFMRDKVGLKFTGIVTGVAAFGLFIELDEIFVQGMVPVATIGGDFWVFREREHRLRGDSTGREMRLGDKVTIEVKSIDEDRHQLEFRLIEIGGSPIALRER
ncbi:MAG TPA: ribonuclease R [Thermoanaerobaculia bacterium]|nr:ribonuclease R [Thermoanaerobaculia bacterium]